MTRIFVFTLAAMFTTSAVAEECFPFCDTSVWKSARCGSLCNLKFWETANLGDIQAQIDGGVNMNAQNDGGWSPLHYAAYMGTTDMLIAMLEAGANVDGLHTETPLNVAIARKQSVFSFWLMEEVAISGSMDLYRDNPYLNRQIYGANTDLPPADLKSVAALVDAGADVNFVNVGGRVALWSAAAFQDAEFVELLFAAGAVVNIADEDGATPLHMSVGRDTSAITQRLLAAGADMTAATIEYGTTPTHNANYENLKLLLEHGADINIRDASGQTPLHFAMAFMELNIVQIAMEAGADMNSRNNNQGTPLHSLVSHSDDMDRFAFAIKEGADIEATNDTGNTPLHNAAISDNFVMVTALLSAGANVEVKNEAGETPLFLGATRGYPNGTYWYAARPWDGHATEVIEALLNAGADIDATNNLGATALFALLPREKFFSQTIDFLREKGAETDLPEHLISSDPSEQYILETRGVARTQVKISPHSEYCYVLTRRSSELLETEIPCPDE